MKPLDRIRAICMALPETEEKISHGSPSFFIRAGHYCAWADNHHGDGASRCGWRSRRGRRRR